MDGASGTVALLGDDYVGLALGVGVFLTVFGLVVVALAVDEGDDVGILLDRAGLAEVGEQGYLVAVALFARARAARAQSPA